MITLRRPQTFIQVDRNLGGVRDQTKQGDRSILGAIDKYHTTSSPNKIVIALSKDNAILLRKMLCA